MVRQGGAAMRRDERGEDEALHTQCVNDVAVCECGVSGEAAPNPARYCTVPARIRLSLNGQHGTRGVVRTCRGAGAGQVAPQISTALPTRRISALCPPMGKPPRPHKRTCRASYLIRVKIEGWSSLPKASKRRG